MKKELSMHMGDSKFLSQLSHYYALAPSAVLIRTAETELLSALPMEPPVLDLCCGDGYFCSLIRPGGVEVGCDMSMQALKNARERALYNGLACADIGKGIPFRDKVFQTVVCNSSLEHVKNVDAALREISRVMKPKGKLYTTFASHYAYEWWPCGPNALKRYLSYQPVYNYFPLEQWEQRMAIAGLRVVGHQYYLSKAAARLLMFLDYHFSHIYMTSDRTLARPFVRGMRIVPPKIWSTLWGKMFSRIKITATDQGGGILIIAERVGLE
jgi:SAM-dependent methyltransferase